MGTHAARRTLTSEHLALDRQHQAIIKRILYSNRIGNEVGISMKLYRNGTQNPDLSNTLKDMKLDTVNNFTPHVSDVPGVIVLTSSVRPSVCVSGCTQGTLCLSVCYHSHDRTDRHTDLNVHLLPEGGWIEKWGGLQKLLKVDEYRTTHSSDID